VTKKGVPETSIQTELRIAQAAAKARLAERMEIGREFLSRDIQSHEALDIVEKEYQKWNDFNSALLKQIFTTDELAKEYSTSGMGPVVIFREPTFGEKVQTLRKRIDRKVHQLDSIIERVALFSVIGSAKQSLHSADPIDKTDTTKSKKVFVVHGRDDAAKANLEAFLREIGLEPIVLHRQADEGLTVIEKFEKHSDVKYAFILLTPDEVAYLASETNKDDAQRDKERRARPNVIFEWGYFVGKLGRSRVCCISTGNVSLPSDMNGLVTKRYVSSVEEVAFQVIKDLRAAGIDAKMM
jgi:predicted nucleotide-binding protein